LADRLVSVSVSVKLTFSVLTEHLSFKVKGVAWMTLGKGFLNNLCVSEIGRCKHNNSVAMPLVMETAAGFFSLFASRFKLPIQET
jgi:hypothetical protein